MSSPLVCSSCGGEGVLYRMASRDPRSAYEEPCAHCAGSRCEPCDICETGEAVTIIDGDPHCAPCAASSLAGV